MGQSWFAQQGIDAVPDPPPRAPAPSRSWFADQGIDAEPEPATLASDATRDPGPPRADRPRGALPAAGVAEPAGGGVMRDLIDIGNSLPRRLGPDIAISALKGAIAIPEAAVGLADMVSGGRAGKALESVGFQPAEAKRILTGWLSDQQQRANRSVEEASGVLDTAIAALSNPSTIAHSAVESAPLMLAGGVAGRVVPGVSAAARGAIGEGVIAAGGAAEATRQASDTGLLTAKQSALAAGTGVATTALGALGQRIAGRLGIEDVDTMIAAGASSPTASRGLAARIALGAVQEGLAEELPQSVSEQVLANVAQGRPVLEGVDHAAVMGAFTGAAMGGGTQVLARARPTAADVVRDGVGGDAAASVVDEQVAKATAEPVRPAAPPAAPTMRDLVETPTLPPVVVADLEARGFDPSAMTLVDAQEALRGGETPAPVQSAIPPAGDAPMTPEGRAAMAASFANDPVQQAAVAEMQAAKRAEAPPRGQPEAFVPASTTPVDEVSRRDLAPEAENVPDSTAVDKLADPDAAPEQTHRYLVEWMASELRELTFEEGGVTRTMAREAEENYRPGDDPGSRYGIGIGASRVAGTPLQEMFKAAGITASRQAIAYDLERYLSGEMKKPTKAVQAALRLAPAMDAAWDGAAFDFSRLTDEQLAAAGVSARKHFRSPVTSPPETANETVRTRFIPIRPTEQAAETAALDDARRNAAMAEEEAAPLPEDADVSFDAETFDAPETDEAISARTSAQVDADLDGYVDRYLKEFGTTLNADNASEMFPDYSASPETRSTRVRAVRPAAAKIIEQAFQRMLGKTVPPTRKKLVVFTSGGNGSGKSSVIPAANKHAFAWDTTASQLGPTAEKIDQALAAGFKVVVNHASLDPVQALTRAVERANGDTSQGRTVTLAGLASTHAGARETLLALADRYKGDRRVDINVFDNNGANKMVPRDLDWLRAREYPTGDGLWSSLREVLDGARAEGRVTDAAYRGFLGRRGSAAPSGPGLRDDSGAVAASAPRQDEREAAEAPVDAASTAADQHVDAVAADLTTRLSTGTGRAVRAGTSKQAPRPFTADNLAEVFGITQEQAVATMALVEAMGLPVDKIELVQGGETDADALAQSPTRLSVLHNLSAENLAFADKMGGIPVPSLGIVKQDGSVQGYGEITLIGRKHLADPTIEPVFDADAYSGRAPQPIYPEVKSKVAQPFYDALKPYATRFDDYHGETWDDLVNRAEPAKVIHRMARGPAAAAWFLESVHGITVAPVETPKGQRREWSKRVDPVKFKALNAATHDSDNRNADSPEWKALHAYLVGVVEDHAASVDAKSPDHNLDMRNVFGYVSGWRGGPSSNWLDDIKSFGYDVIRDVEADLENRGKKRVDSLKTNARVAKALKGKEAEFARWVDDKVWSMFGEPFLKVGGRKVPYTLANIVEASTSARIRGDEKTMTYGDGKARAAASTRFSDIEQMRSAAETSIMDEDAIAAGRNEAKDALEAYRDAVIKYYRWDNTWDALDGSMRAIARYAGGAKTAFNLRNALRREDFKVERLDDDDMALGMEAARLMLAAPVPYFEAKPQRAVNLSEFAGAVVPKDASPETLAILERAGLPVATYPSKGGSTRETARRAVVVKFRQRLAREGKDVLFQRGGLFDDDADILDTGEAQPRLPGDVGAVRDEERPTPKLSDIEDEFRLTSEVEKRKGHQRTLFQVGDARAVLNERQDGDRGAQPKASVEFAGIPWLESGKALIRALTNPDVSSPVHEIAHVARRFLLNRDIPAEMRQGVSDDDIATTEAWAGAKDGKWDTPAEEKFARGFERYLREGGPTLPSSIRDVFEKMAVWLTEVYESITGSAIDVDITPEIRKVFDRLVTRKERLAVESAAKSESVKSGPPKAPPLDIPAHRPYLRADMKPSEMMWAYVDETWKSRFAQADLVDAVVKATGRSDFAPGRVLRRKEPSGPPITRRQQKENILRWMDWSDRGMAEAAKEQKAETKESGPPRTKPAIRTDAEIETLVREPGRVFSEAQRAYRAKEISDAEFLAARTAFDASGKTLDADDEERQTADPLTRVEQKARDRMKDRGTTEVLFQDSDERQTDTPAFRRWFGDSEAVDGSGEPLRVFHGTSNPTFEKFSKAHRRGMGGPLGFWFATSGEAASQFARDQYAGQGAAVYPVFLRVENPMRYQGWDDFVAHVSKLQKGGTVEDGTKALRAALARRGYDGLVIVGSETDGGGKRDDWVAFEPTQIKSATGNRGTFDPKNPNILYQDTAEPLPLTRDDRDDLVVIGAAKLARGLDRKAWDAAMRREFGDKIAPFLAGLHDLSAARAKVAKEVDVEDYFNLKRLDVSEAEKVEISSAILESIYRTGRVPKERESWEQIRAEAKEMAPEVLEQLKPFQEMQAPFRAVRLIARERIATLNQEVYEGRLALEGIPGDAPEAIQRERVLAAKEHDLQGLMDVWMRQRSEDGRNLAMHRMMVGSIESWYEPTFWYSKARRELGLPVGTQLPHDVWRALQDILGRGRTAVETGQPVEPIQLELSRFLQRLQRSTWLEIISAVRKAGLLTGPKTHARNILGNLAFASLEEMSRIPAVLIDFAVGVATGHRTVHGVSPRAVANASREAATKGLHEAADIFRTGSTASSLMQVDAGRELNSGFRWLDAYANTVFRTMGAVDRVFKSYAFRRSMEEQAALEAINRGVSPIELLANPPAEMLARAVTDAEFATFNNPNLLAGGVADMKASLKRKGQAGKVTAFAIDMAVPFLNTPSNILARMFDYTPGGATLALSRAAIQVVVNKSLTAEQQRIFAQGIGRGATGSALIYLGYMLAAAGLASGMGGDDEGDRNVKEAAGVLPGAVKVGGRWHQIATFSPAGNLVALGASIYRSATMPLKDELLRGAKISAVALRLALDQPMLKGMSDIIATLQRPEARAESFAAGMAGSFVPTFVNDIASAFDPYRRDTRPEGGYKHSVWTGVAARLPGARNLLPSRLTVLGDQQTQDSRAIWDPTIATVARDLQDDVLRELIAHDVGIAWPRQTKNETAETYRKRVVDTGAEIKLRVGRLIASPNYRRQKDDTQAEMIGDAISDARQRVRERQKKSGPPMRPRFQ